METNGQVGATARMLGFAGLLPQIAAVLLILAGRGDARDGGGMLMFFGYWLALGYGALILSFLGGMWWGFAMRRTAGQGRLVVAAVVPSLFAGAVLALVAGAAPPFLWPALALGGAILLTLPVDRHLARTGEAPVGWMRLRVPLSLGLGGLTIAAGVLL